MGWQGREKSLFYSVAKEQTKEPCASTMCCSLQSCKKFLLSCELWRTAMIYFHVERGQRYSSSLSNKLHTSGCCAGWSVLSSLAYPYPCPYPYLLLQAKPGSKGHSTSSLADPATWTWANPALEAFPILIKSRPNHLLMFLNFRLSIGI